MLKLSGKFIKKKCGLYLSCLLCAGLLAACQAEESCVSFTTNVYEVGFLTLDEEGNAQPVEWDFVDIEALETDSLLFNPAEEASAQVLLPLNPASDTTTFLFRYGYGTDTLRLTYERLFHLISLDCGTEIRYRQFEVAYHTFDSVSLLTNELQSTTAGVDLHIFQLDACQSPLRSYLEAGFFALNEMDEKEALNMGFNRVRALESDSVLYEGGEAGINNINLPLHVAEGATSTRFVFEHEAGNDTLTIGYEQQQVQGAPECGLETAFTDLQVIAHTFDSVSLLSQVLIETNDVFDVEIYP